MNELRNLLLDCRAALRRADEAFDDGPLRPRIDQTIIAMGTAKGRRQDDVHTPPTFTAQQVAFAWQQAARELHFTHPQIYAELGAWVRDRLGDDTLVDPAAELLQLQAQLRELQASSAAREAELSALQATLAAAVALDGTDADGSEAERAQRRLRLLVDAASHGNALPRPKEEHPDDIAPTREELRAVAAGTRVFSAAEREWCIGEAVVRTAFERTPEQLLADGDRALAQLLQQGP
ncbi:hypothetical protein [Cognatiluteimonas telluris]|uniref:hypothetical protein n=1 Tax=Cognatiluteimonas telluris TaxID=1104775 RepID=UPI0014097B45|nr:hypothetical protein [Lysobacter telluris]